MTGGVYAIYPRRGDMSEESVPRSRRVLRIGLGAVATLLVLLGSMCSVGPTVGGSCSVGACSNGVLGARMILVPSALPLALLVWLAARPAGQRRSTALVLLALLATAAYIRAWVAHFDDVALLEACCPPD